MTKKIIIAVIIAVILLVGGNMLLKKMGQVEYRLDTETEAPKIENKINDELQRIIDEENFKKETILRARKVANDRKKEEEIERNKKAMSVIEAEYEAIRQAELLLVGGSNTNSSSLK